MSAAAAIAALNDALRHDPTGWYMTPGVAALTVEQRTALVAQVRAFSQFEPGNDPYGEHDFGAVTVADERFFFKIDYYDRDLVYHSPDPTDPAVTRRVLTLMRADEY